MKRNLILLMGVLLAIGLQAQTASPVVVVSTRGSIQYISADQGLKAKVTPGAVIKSDGTLKLGRNASAIVLYDGRIKRLAGVKGAVPLATLLEQERLARLNYFDPDFADYTQAAVELVASRVSNISGWGRPVNDTVVVNDGWGGRKAIRAGDGWRAITIDPVRSGDGWGRGASDTVRVDDGWGGRRGGVNDTLVVNDGWGGRGGLNDTLVVDDGWGGRGGVNDTVVVNDAWGGRGGLNDTVVVDDGWGGRGSKITLIMPFGYVSPGVVDFTWSRPARANAFILDIHNGNKSIYQVTVNDTSSRVDLRTLGLVADQKYSWRVSAADNNRFVSNIREFTIAPEETKAKALKKASTSAFYADSEADPALRVIMEAVALEKAGFYYDANQAYAAAYQKYSGNNMLRMMYAAFLMRYKLEPKAKGIVKR